MQSRLFIALLGIVVATTAVADDANAAQASFQALLQESGLQLEQPDGYVVVPVRANPVLAYEHALRHDSGSLEMRFIVRPLGRIRIEYDDPHNASPEPNHLFPLLFESITNRLALGSNAPSNTLSEPEAQKRFNAHWVAISAFDIDPEYAGGYHNGVLVALHRNDLADAYTLFLYDDYSQVKPLIDESLSVLSFAPTPGVQ